MTIVKYCKEKNFSKEEYKNFKANIEATAKTIRNSLKYNNGIYYSVDDLFDKNIDNDIKCMLINVLKKMNIEFFDNDTLYRVVD